MGSLKGPVIHDTFYKILKASGKEVLFRYGFDDMDPIDGLAPNLQEKFSKYLGVPLFLVPSPDGIGSFADYFSQKMTALLDTLEIKPDLYRTHEIYQKGEFDNAIKEVLDHVEKVRKVYGDIYHKTIPDTWYPFQIICPKCCKLGTTKVTGWDGKEVTFVCEKHLVAWAEGCGTTGKISPFGGRGKMPWKVEWASKWATFGVTIEAAGKDHASAGGSYDVAMRICEEVFNKKPPLKLGYEFFLSGGKKMSSSKGLGMTGEELLEVLEPRVARFLMIKVDPSRAVEFTPRETDIIPKLYDEYQKSANAYFEKKDEDAGRAFELTQINEPKRPPQVRFSVLAQLIQMPNMQEEIQKAGYEDWARYARIWVDKYAPDSEKFVVAKELPQQAKELSKEQKNYLKKVATELEKKWNPEDFQKALYVWSKELAIPSKDAFAAIYLALIGKNHGPKAGWLILSLDKEFVRNRFSEIDKVNIEKDDQKTNVKTRRLNKPEIFSISNELKKKYPSISVGIAIIKGVSIKKDHAGLEKEKNDLLKSLEGLTTEQLGQFPEITSYRRLYKETGIDWHSRRPSPEALLRRVALKKGLYTINTCVDAYNLVVMKNRISVGAFDLDKIIFPTTLRFALENEEILILGDKENTKYKNGEIAYFDGTGGYNIDFNYRDSQRTAVTEQTKNLYLNVDGVYEIQARRVEEVLRESCEIIIKYCGGKIEDFGIETAE